jgi:hypothetical protein
MLIELIFLINHVEKNTVPSATQFVRYKAVESQRSTSAMYGETRAGKGKKKLNLVPIALLFT